MPIWVIARASSSCHSHLGSTTSTLFHINIVCQAAGLTTAVYSFGYVAGWSGGNSKAVTATAERVTTCARTILDRAA